MSASSSTFTSTNDPQLTSQVLSENLEGDAYASHNKKVRDPYFFERDESGAWRVVSWLEPRIGRERLQIALELLRDHGWVARADAIISCGCAFIPFKGCLKTGPDGRWHELHAVLGFCNTAFCPYCSEPTRRLHHFLSLDEDRVLNSIYQIANTLSNRGYPTSIKRIVLAARTVKATRGRSFRQRQETLQKQIDRWRERVCRKYGVRPEEHGILIADGLRKGGASARLLYVGPDIPDSVMRDTWEEIVGTGWEFDISSATLCAHEMATDEVGHRGLIEAELQRLMEANHHFVSMLKTDEYASMHVMFRNYRMMRRVGSFYGQKVVEVVEQMSDVDSDAEPLEMTEAEIDAAFNSITLIPSDYLGTCATCQDPLIALVNHKPSNYQDLDGKASSVKYYRPNKRQEHKHSTVHKCPTGSPLRKDVRALLGHSPPS